MGILSVDGDMLPPLSVLRTGAQFGTVAVEPY
jgi:hypothetical protein